MSADIDFATYEKGRIIWKKIGLETKKVFSLRLRHQVIQKKKESGMITMPLIRLRLMRCCAGGVELNHRVWECSAGQGHLSERLIQLGYEVRSTDLIDRGYGTGGVDFLQENEIWDGDILTNPPYKYAKEFIEHAMELIPDGRKVFMFLKLQFLEGKGRKELFEKYPPRVVYVSRSRILCAKNGMFDEMRAAGGSAVAYAWYEFQKGYKGVSIIKWIN